MNDNDNGSKKINIAGSMELARKDIWQHMCGFCMIGGCGPKGWFCKQIKDMCQFDKCPLIHDMEYDEE